VTFTIAMSVSEEAIQTKDWGDPLLRPCKARKPMKGYAGSPLWPHAEWRYDVPGGLV